MPDGYIALSGIGPKIEGLKWESECLLRMGRQANLEVVLRDTSVERLHAEVKFQGQRWMLKDLADSSYYPTFLNGTCISGKAEHLKLNDLVQLGKLKMRVTAIGVAMMDKPSAPPARKRHRKAAPAPAAPAKTILLQDSSTDGLLPAPRAVAPTPGVTKPGVLVMTSIHRASLCEIGTVPGELGPKADLQLLQVQASTQQSWDQAVAQATQSPSRRPDSDRAMRTLLRTNQHVSSQASLDELLANILADVVPMLDAQRAAILLANPVSGQLELKAVFASDPTAAGKKAFSRTLAERCFRQGEALLCRDINGDRDPRLVRGAPFGSMTSIVCAVVRTPRIRLGVLHLDRGPLQEPFAESDLYLADAVAATVAGGIECVQLVAHQSERFLETVAMLARAADMRDQYTANQTKRVTALALMLADDLKLSKEECQQIRIGTPLHDIGKIGIDDAVLRKPGKLTDGEFEHVKSHTIKGAALLDGLFNLAPLVPIVRSHHERWDGTGYPDKIGRDQIALPARIVAVADTFNAMTSPRPYRPALPPQLAFLELLSKAGTHFDPHVVQSFVKLRPRVEEIVRTHGDAS